jgi:uncharacterized protein YjbI with pentapeptide repeats
MRAPAWLGIGERRWKKRADEEVQPAKTLWDWLQLLVVPAMLAALALFFSASQASRDRSREDRRIREDRALAESARQDATLEAYFAQMTNLMLDRNLLRSRPPSEVQAIARTATLTAVRRLNGRRKGELIRFLAEAGLLSGGELSGNNPPPVDVSSGDLRAADLTNADLDGARLDGADLRGARFDHASLRHSSLGTDTLRVLGTDLRGASFKHATIEDTDFDGADLSHAAFDYAWIADSKLGSCLDHTSFRYTNFNPDVMTEETMGIADFGGAEGGGVDFSHALHLSTLNVHQATLWNVRLDGADGRPKGWGPTGPRKPAMLDLIECTHR